MGIAKLSPLRILLSLLFFKFFSFFKKGTKMNLTTVVSILCFVSLFAGIPSSVGAKDSEDEPSVKRKTGRMLFGSRENRETCKKEREPCSIEKIDQCCNGLKCDWPICPRGGRSFRWCRPVCKKPWIPKTCKK